MFAILRYQCPCLHFLLATQTHRCCTISHISNGASLQTLIHSIHTQMYAQTLILTLTHRHSHIGWGLRFRSRGFSVYLWWLPAERDSITCRYKNCLLHVTNTNYVGKDGTVWDCAALSPAPASTTLGPAAAAAAAAAVCSPLLHLLCESLHLTIHTHTHKLTRTHAHKIKSYLSAFPQQMKLGYR